MLEKIHWFGQSSILIEAGTTRVYIDPVSLKKEDKAGIILVTHDHADHYSLADINRLATDDTTVISPFAIRRVRGKHMLLPPGKGVTLNGIAIEAVPAYNVRKTQFHPKASGYVGYIVTVEGQRIYHAGDTERIPEMKRIACDIALLPLGQTFTMNSVDEAVLAALDVKAKIAIPIHFGLYEGSQKDAERFVGELTRKGVESLVLRKE